MIISKESEFNTHWPNDVDMPYAVRTYTSRHRTGEIFNKGAKLSAPKLVLAAGLTAVDCYLRNVPDMMDVQSAIDYQEASGVEFDLLSEDELVISAANRKILNERTYRRLTVDDRSTGTRTAAIDLATNGFGRLYDNTGGCDIGDRNSSRIAGILEAMGAEPRQVESGIELSTKGLIGARVNAERRIAETESALLAGVLAKGKTEIEDGAITPEVLELAGVLMKMGAKIKIDEDNRTFTVTGVSELEGYDHTLKPCRLKAASYAILAAMTDSEITVNGNANSMINSMKTFHEELVKRGGGYDVSERGITYYRNSDKLTPLGIYTGDYPEHVDYDNAALLSAMDAFAVFENLSRDNGNSRIDEPITYHDSRYENRPKFLDTLRFYGLDVELTNECKVIDCEFNGSDNYHVSEIFGLIEDEVSPDALEPRVMKLSKFRLGQPRIIVYTDVTPSSNYNENIIYARTFQSPAFENQELRGSFGQLAFALASDSEGRFLNASLLNRGYDGLFGELKNYLDMNIFRLETEGADCFAKEIIVHST